MKASVQRLQFRVIIPVLPSTVDGLPEVKLDKILRATFGARLVIVAHDKFFDVISEEVHVH